MPQEPVPLKSEMKGGGDDVVDEKEMQTAGAGITSSATSGVVHIDGATGPTAVAVNSIHEATSVDMPVYEMKAKAEKERKQQLPAKATVRIAGAMGLNAGAINGIYEATTEMSGDMPVYVKVDDSDIWLLYCAALKQWQVKITAHKDGDDGFALCGVPAKCLPEDCPAGRWYVYDDIVPQPAVAISVVTQEEADAYLAEVKREAARVVRGSQHVRIAGATGTNAGIINGLYKPTEELSGNVALYVKIDDGDMWLVYLDSSKNWNVQTTANKGTDLCWAYCHVPVKCLPDECPRGLWQVADCAEGGPQPAVTISMVTQDEVEAYLAEVQREAARLVNGSQHVLIAGATGPKADYINGVYKPTEELCGNATVYVMVGDGSKWLEFNAALKTWQVKETAHKGTNLSWANCAVPVKCLPEDCPPGMWEVYDGTKFNTQSAVTISVQQDNSNAVSTGDADNDEEAKPKAAAMKVESGAAVTQTAGVGVGIASHLTSGGVRIVGAMGPNAGAINGMYEGTTEFSDGMPIYAKVGDGDMWLEYCAGLKTWQVKPTSAKGTEDCMVCCDVSARCLPEECPAGQWEIFANAKFVPLPAIVISVVTLDEVEAYRAQVEEEAARVVKGCHDVTIAGATGTLAGDINGIYKSTEELCDNATVYAKAGDGGMWLKYHASKKQWQVKDTDGKDTSFSWAFCAVPVKCLPEDCPRGKWLVYNGSKWGPQQTVTISVQHDNSDAASANDVDDDEAKPKAAAMKVESGAVVSQTAGVGVDIVSSAASRCVRIVGATGQNACAVNGIYEATTEMSGDMPVYVKVDDSDMCLAYHAAVKQWLVKITAEGTDGCISYCAVPVKCLPEDCPAGRWYVYDGTKIDPQPAVTISVVTQKEIEAYLAELKREAARVVKGSQHVRINGATGPAAGLINGIYKPTQECCSNVTVYRKVDDVDMWLEYRAATMSWQVKDTAAKGKDGCMAFCAVPTKCLPEKCPAGQWKVNDGSKLAPQPAVTIKQKKKER